MAMLGAIDSALTLGTLMGLSETWSSSWHYYRSQPDAERGRAVKSGASQGGKERAEKSRNDETREQAIKLYGELQAKYRRQSKYFICQQVGRKIEPKRHGRTIARWIAAAGGQ